MSSGVVAEMPALSASALDDDDPFCAQCGTELGEDQEWCLECGAARTLIHRSPDWRIPVAIVAAVVLLVLGGVAIALVNVSRSANAAAAQAGTPTTATAVATPAPANAAVTQPRLGSWPVGLSGWTVVLFTSRRQATARATATRLATHGLGVGLLNSDQHPNLARGNWIVFTGRYPHGTEAAAAAARLRASGHPAARVRQVARPGGL